MAGSQGTKSVNGDDRNRPRFEALLTYSTDRNMCRGAIQYLDKCGLVKRQPALFMNVSYFNNLGKYATEEESEISELKKKERLKDLENSRLLSKDWWDTPENLKRAKEEEKQMQKKKYEEESARILREMEILNRETERQILTDANTLKFEARQDIRELHGACLLSEVLEERAAQISFNDRIKRLKDEREKKHHESDKEAIFAYFKKEAEKAEEKRKVGLRYGKELVEQTKSRNKLKFENERDVKELERNFFDALSRIKSENIKQKNIEEYLKNLKNDELNHKLMEEERQKDDEMEAKHIKDYHESVHQLNEALKKRKNEKLIASQARSKAAAERLLFFSEKVHQREAKERENIERDVKKLAERQEQRALDDENRRKKLAADFLAVNIKQRLEEETKKEALPLVKNVDRLRAMKLEEDCIRIKDNKYLQEKEKQAISRAILKEQMDFKAMKEEKARKEMERYREGLRALQKKADEESLKYGCALTEKSKANGRNVRPLEKMLKLSYNEGMEKRFHKLCMNRLQNIQSKSFYAYFPTLFKWNVK